jgi:lysine 6-dehydrogenase
MRIIIVGAGLQARAIAHDIVKNPALVDLVIGDVEQARADALVKELGTPKAKAMRIDATRPSDLIRIGRNTNCVIGATTYKHNAGLTKACIELRANFCDLGGNVDTVRAQHAMNADAERAGVTIIPDCGLAPGMVNVLAYHWAKDFDRVDDMQLRVGGLPQKPTTSLSYQLVFSVEGLINEYIEDCVILKNGKPETVKGMSGVEALSFGGKLAKLEAFFTSGGTSTLPETLSGKVKNLDYKTIRYPGHAEKIQLLMDLGLFSSAEIPVDGRPVVPRRVGGQLLTRFLPTNQPDLVLVRVALRGKLGKKNATRIYDCVDKFDPKSQLTAMQRTTGFPVAIIAQMLASGAVAKKGVVPQELAIDGTTFLGELKKRNIRFSEKKK